MSFIDNLFGDQNKKLLRQIEPLVGEINQFESAVSALTAEQLRDKTQEFRGRLSGGAILDDLLPEAFAVTREAARRVLGQRHFDVQLLGGIALHQGMIAEMKTGEGKTLTATLAVYLNALAGRGVHVVTVNDYLAKRDMVWMGHIYNFLGLSVACIMHERAYRYKTISLPPGDLPKGDNFQVDDALESVTRQEAYAADITYGTNNEFGFDYLRDNMAFGLEQMVQRQNTTGAPLLAYAIVDEVDSILIDEARTPLIISAPAEESGDTYARCAVIVRRLQAETDYVKDEKMRAVTLTEAGINAVEKALGVDNLYVEAGVRMVHHIEQALRAEVLYQRDRDYVNKEGEIIIVDEFTGRLMPGRRYSEGLHQAIEAKEGVKVQRESLTLATITFQNLFRMYDKLAGMTGTAATEKEEFQKIYNLDVAVIPTNKPNQRHDLTDRVYKTEAGKLQAIVQEVKARQAKGQPILIGTISIEKNERLAQALATAGLKAEVLNAKNHEREAQIIAQAGRRGAIMVATNMAGRGVDIILGGNPPDPTEQAAVKVLGGLFVLGTERHESRRIDNQLRGRSGRQGDPGESLFMVSLEDDLLRIFGSDRLKGLMERMGVPDDMPIEHTMVGRSLEQAQKKVEGHHFDTRKHLLQYDDVLNKHREVIYRKRRDILVATQKPETPALRGLIETMIEEELEQVVLFHTQEGEPSGWEIKPILETARTIFSIPAHEEQSLDHIRAAAADKESVAAARTALVQFLLTQAKAVYDGVEATIAKTLSEHGNAHPRPVAEIEKQVLLRAIDSLWIEHLEAMQYLRTGIGLQGYGQRDPLVEYQREGYSMFNELLQSIRKYVVMSIFKTAQAAELVPAGNDIPHNISISGPAKTMERSSSNVATAFADQQTQRAGDAIPEKERDATGEKIGRNDPCPCGSGKKYKKCHGA